MQRKIAVFVEGQTERIFVREFLLRWYEYNGERLGIKCYKLFAESLCDAPWDFAPDPECENFYQIVDVGNDKKVLSKMLAEAENLKDAGFELVIGLRDMYSADYRSEVRLSQCIDPEINRKFIEGAAKVLAGHNSSIEMQLHFAIMEVEAWIIALLGHCPPDIDPETTIFHPAEELKRIEKDKGSDYAKHESQVEAIMSNLSKDDFTELLNSNRCNSFKKFVAALC